MRTFLGIGSVVALVMLAACASNEPQPARDPISGNDPTPQKAINKPEAQTSQFQGHSPQTAAITPERQDPSFNSQPSQQPFSNPDPQKPYDPIARGSVDERGAKTDKPLSDGEILTVARVANEGEAQIAELAKKKATAAETKQFATMMFAHHTAGVQKVKQVQTKTKLEGASSDLSTKVEGDASRALNDLRDKSGKDFDHGYIDSQVKMHKDLLDALDHRLIVGATNADLKSTLTEMRRQVADHLTKAEDIQKKLDARSASFTNTTPSDRGTVGNKGTTTPAMKGKSEPVPADPAKDTKRDEPKY